MQCESMKYTALDTHMQNSFSNTFDTLSQPVNDKRLREQNPKRIWREKK